jgi:hypothetical protein
MAGLLELTLGHSQVTERGIHAGLLHRQNAYLYLSWLNALKEVADEV